MVWSKTLSSTSVHRTKGEFSRHWRFFFFCFQCNLLPLPFLESISHDEPLLLRVKLKIVSPKSSLCHPFARIAAISSFKSICSGENWPNFFPSFYCRSFREVCEKSIWRHSPWENIEFQREFECVNKVWKTCSVILLCTYKNTKSWKRFLWSNGAL